MGLTLDTIICGELTSGREVAQMFAARVQLFSWVSCSFVVSHYSKYCSISSSSISYNQKDKMTSEGVTPFRSTQLRERTVGFITAFKALTKGKMPPHELLSEHFVASPFITEHGPKWAQSVVPVLGRTYWGVEDCLEYFTVLNEAFTCHFTEDSFPSAMQIAIDIVAEGPDDEVGRGRGVAFFSGQGSFMNKLNGKTLRECFSIRLSGFDEDAKIGHWEFWGDTLSAYAAVAGRHQLD